MRLEKGPIGACDCECDVRLRLLSGLERSVYSRARPAGSLNCPCLFLELVPCYRVYDILVFR